jgi:hypothetical protein
VLEGQPQGDQHLLDDLVQIERAPTGAALVYCNLLEVPDQISGTSAVALQEVDGFATPG